MEVMTVIEMIRINSHIEQTAHENTQNHTRTNENTLEHIRTHGAHGTDLLLLLICPDALITIYLWVRRLLRASGI